VVIVTILLVEIWRSREIKPQPAKTSARVPSTD